jgi:Ca2+-binding EF-hand superfamily protein
MPKQQLRFAQEEVDAISKRFNQLCNQLDFMTYEDFRRGLGLLGREDSFICRIFNLVDKDRDGKITE